MSGAAVAGARRAPELAPPARWLPPGKTAAVCLSIDDVHPAGSADGCDAGGDLSDGALGRLA